MEKAKTLLWALLIVVGCLSHFSNGRTQNKSGKDVDTFLFTYSQCSDFMDPPDCSDPEGPEFFAVPGDCSLYYRRIRPLGLVYCYSCPPGYYFDPSIFLCKIASEVNCTSITTLPPTTTPQSTTTDDPINWVCPEGYDGLIRHPYDCGRFYDCDPEYGPCLYECQTGFYYNLEVGGCDHKENVRDCEGGSPPPPTRTTVSTYAFSVKHSNKKQLNLVPYVHFSGTFIRKIMHKQYHGAC